MREPSYGARWPAAIVLIVLNVVVYAAQLVVPLAGGNLGRPGPHLETFLALSPIALAKGYVWQLVTFQFLHGSLLHLILNCAMLYMFGRPVEEVLGRKQFTVMYLASGAIGGLVQCGCAWAVPQHFGLGAVLGASAGVFALIAAFAALNWEEPITTLVAFIIPVTMRAKYLVLAEAIIALLGMLAGQSGIAHAAHLGGMLAGLAYVRYIFRGQPSLFRWRRPRPLPRRRELVGASAPRRAGWQTQGARIPDDLPPAEFMSREVDPILDKIHAQGMQSLTDRERRILEAAVAKMRKR